MQQTIDRTLKDLVGCLDGDKNEIAGQRKDIFSYN